MTKPPASSPESKKLALTSRERLRQLADALAGDAPGPALLSAQDRFLIAKALRLIERTRPDMHHVEFSSNVRAVGYDAVFDELWVTFKGETTYVYYEVPQETHKAMMAADSKGGFLHANIKGKFEFKRVN